MARRRHLLPPGQCVARAGRAPGRLPLQGRSKGDRMMVTGGCASAAGRPPRATSGRSPRSRPTRSGPPSSGLPLRSSAPASAATATATPVGSAPPSAAPTSTTHRRFEHRTILSAPSAPAGGAAVMGGGDDRRPRELPSRLTAGLSKHLGPGACHWRYGSVSKGGAVSRLRRESRRASPASTARSAQSSRGRVTCRRSTATSWRSISSSALLVLTKWALALGARTPAGCHHTYGPATRQGPGRAGPQWSQRRRQIPRSKPGGR
jgi:hypothetical protein